MAMVPPTIKTSKELNVFLFLNSIKYPTTAKGTKIITFINVSLDPLTAKAVKNEAKLRNNITGERNLSFLSNIKLYRIIKK